MEEVKEDFSKFCITCLEHKPFSLEEINSKRTSIEQEVEKMVKHPINVSNFNTILTDKVLKKITELYDSKFFYGKLLENLKKNSCVLRVCFDNRCTKTAGTCFFDRCKQIVIKLATKVFQKALQTGSIKVNSGLECSKFLTCLLITFEHELIHGLAFCLCQDYRISWRLERFNPGLNLFKGEFNDKSGHGKLFMTIVNNKFGHTKYKHNLFSHKPKPDAQGNKYKLLSDSMTIPQIRKTLKIGDKVIVFSNKGTEEGTIYKILTKFMGWRDGEGKRWKMPISRIVESKPKSLSPKANVKTKAKAKSPKANVKTKVKSPKANVKTKVKSPKAKAKSPSPKKKKIIKKTQKITWDGPHQDKFIPGVAKEYTGKRISSLDEAKRVSIELGDKSSGFTKKKFYSIRNGKTLRKADGDISWMKK
jgi:hypothetical protein